jgi:hypothetical protein
MNVSKMYFIAFLLTIVSSSNIPSPASVTEAEWISLFDGQSLDGWKANESPGTFQVKDGMIAIDGPRGHLFYVGPLMNHDFKNFEFKAQVLTKPGANSGIYFHTRYEEVPWPTKGYEAQVNNTQSDWRRTGSLYAVKDVKEVFTKDEEWFTEHVIVQGKRIIIKINDVTVVDYTEPANPVRQPDMQGRLLSSGTFALQGHDPDSKVFYKNIMVKILP